jgi:hypothetical protein
MRPQPRLATAVFPQLTFRNGFMSRGIRALPLRASSHPSVGERTYKSGVVSGGGLTTSISQGPREVGDHLTLLQPGLGLLLTLFQSRRCCHRQSPSTFLPLSRNSEIARPLSVAHQRQPEMHYQAYLPAVSQGLLKGSSAITHSTWSQMQSLTRSAHWASRKVTESP